MNPDTIIDSEYTVLYNYSDIGYLPGSVETKKMWDKLLLNSGYGQLKSKHATPVSDMPVPSAAQQTQHDANPALAAMWDEYITMWKLTRE